MIATPPPSADFSSPFMAIFALMVSYGLGYLLGSIPFGLLLTKFAGAGDIRQIGSGNIGATNVLRTGKKGLAALTLALDAIKGAVAVMIGLHFSPALGLIAGAAAMLGHSYPIWLNYKGGKGVATAFGITCGIYWPLGLAAGFTWVVVLVMVRLSSVAALAAVTLAPFYAYILDRRDLVLFFIGIGIFIWWRHRKNIRQLISGEEPQISFGKSGEAAIMAATTVAAAMASENAVPAPAETVEVIEEQTAHQTQEKKDADHDPAASV
ncbi:MAG: glycerol-3-phosphate 1-O-acyltransferase PlsY [Alphaproteobacteria bacterium]